MTTGHEKSEDKEWFQKRINTLQPTMMIKTKSGLLKQVSESAGVAHLTLAKQKQPWLLPGLHEANNEFHQP